MTWWSTVTESANEAFQKVCEDQAEINQDPQDKGKPDKPIQGGTAKAKINGVRRKPWVMTTTEWAKSGRGIVWEANPSEVTWSMPQRSMHSKNLRGTVLHVWPDTERGTFFDEIRLHFNFQSGSILPILDGQYKPSGGIQNFYEFMNLVDAPKLTSENPPRANLVKIYYNSNLFPKITLIGMFDSNGISFTDSSAEPNQVVGWGADFIVYDSTPKLSANMIANTVSNKKLLNIWDREKIKQNPNLSRINSTGIGGKGVTLPLESGGGCDPYNLFSGSDE